MRKMHKLFSMLLAVAMLLTSTVALAEETVELYSINLSDLIMSMDDETVLDLSGLTVSLGVGGSDSEGLISASILGGEEAAVTATAALADGKVAVNVDGMSKPLTLDLAALLTEENIQAFMNELTAQFTEEELAALTQIYTAAMALVSEENLSLMEAGYETYMGEVQTIVAENMTQTEGEANAFIVGPEEEISSTLISLTLDGDDISALMNSAAKFYDSNPAIVDLINGALLLEGEDVQITSYADLMNQEEMQEVYNAMKITADIYVSDDYDNGYVDVVVSVYDVSGEEEEKVADVVFGIGVADSVRAVMLISDEYEDEIYADFSVVESEEYAGQVETSFYMSATEDGEEEELLNLWIGPDPDYGTLGVLAIGPEGDSVGLAWGYSDSQVVFNVYDDYGMNMEIGYVTDYEGAEAGEGTIYLNVDENGTTYQMEAVVSTNVTMVSVEELHALAAAEGIDMMNISEEDTTALMGELQTILLSAINTLGENVPGIAQLMGSMVAE